MNKIVNGQSVPLTQEEILEFQNSQLDAITEDYSALRARDYPQLAEQLDYIYHNGVEAWKTDIIDPIKARYPKP